VLQGHTNSVVLEREAEMKRRGSRDARLFSHSSKAGGRGKETELAVDKN